MKFDHLISRADEEVLQELIGQGPLKLLSLLDKKLLSPARQRSLLLRLKRPQELLSNSESRTLLLDLLRPNEASLLSKVLGNINDINPYTYLKNVNFSVKTQFSALLSFFELSQIIAEQEEEKPTELQIIPKYPLFRHQRNAVRDIDKVIGEDPYRAMLHMPTGSGKTRTALHLVAEHMGRNEPTLVVWLANSEELCEQAFEEFRSAWGFLGNREVTIVRYWGIHNPDLLCINDGFVVASLQKTISAAKKSINFISKLGLKTSFVVMDEAHQAVAPSYQMILEALVDPYPGTKLLGLTATPGRTWSDIASDEQLAQFFAARKVSLTIPGYSNPIEYLEAERYLAKARFRSLFYQSGLSLSSTDLDYIEENLDLPRRLLEKLADDQKRNLRIIVEVEKLTLRHHRLILFALSVQHSDLLAAVLQARCIDAYSITSRTPLEERRRILARYREDGNQSMVLCNYGVLTTGFDAPRTSAAVITRPTKSLVLYSQMVGRAIRGTRAGGNENAEIVTVVDSCLPGFGNVAEAFANWEDVWREE